MKVMWARLRRRAHQLWIGFRPWRWEQFPPCRAITHLYAGPENHYRIRATWLSCTCGREFYRAKGHDPKKFSRMFGTGH